ncbi:hypothetical protein M758_2G190800 [Ceratodon purpureus]|nr:hypothetical protein M758_2G190800 [Ceratodon purpureus]KAG0627308.1 hypothetical protein M758_2G190800 [Ceratodon purpureus]
MEALCDFCESVNFEAVGYQERQWLQQFDGFNSNGDERTNRPIRDILQNVKCIFCRVVAESFHDWSRGKFVMQALDLQNDSNEACYEIVRLHSYSKTLIRLKVALKVFTYERVAHCVNLEFQKFSEPRQDSDNNPQQGEAYLGRRRPLLIDADVGRFKGWISDCCDASKSQPHDCGKRTHTDGNGQCTIMDQIGEFMVLDGLRLIDVERMCVVDVQNDVSYTALSYVWGLYQKLMPKLTTENLVSFRNEDALKRLILPATIADAIELTKRLGYAYIWIDSLCIVQGDELDERYFIPQMDVIFGCAVVTIVAAAGNSADAGLPGINELKPRSREQAPFKVKGIPLVRTLDPEQSRKGNSSFNGYLKESQWCKRGWTFQEKLLSPRALIFTEEQVYWECQTASWCEDGHWEQSPGIIYRHCFGDNDYCLPWQEGFERKYRKMVEEYSGRTFKFEKDRRDAFEGILQRFQYYAKGRQLFLWALPKRFLSNALTWYCKEISPQRRVEKCRVTSEWGQPIKDCPFPSWSWLGWAGKVCFNHPLDASTVDLSFYYFFGGKLLSARQTDATVRLSKNMYGVDLDYNMIRRSREDGDETIVTLEDIPKSLDRVLVQEADQSNILFFWSSTAILHVRRDGVESDGSARLLVCNNVANSFGVIGDIPIVSWLHKPSNFPPGHAELVEFVLIGLKVSINESFFTVLLVERKNGVAYRQGLVHIECLVTC